MPQPCASAQDDDAGHCPEGISAEWTGIGGSAQIRKWDTNFCLTGETHDGGSVWLSRCSTGVVWKGFKMHGAPPDWYQLTAYNRPYCLDMPRSSQADGQAPQFWSCVNSNANQHLTWYPF
ncbi:hypothetical protein AB0M20_10360 [Actinoplanes sp. NPDC051633]|uniref:RICIN domain-containing protein n=1 Tax=Actinoplanes sp. NPDC051633 TaxID=3155670 RepID=UPI003422E30D